MKKEVTDKDMGLDRLIKNLTELRSSVVKVGLFSEDDSADGTMNIAKLGYIQEKGAVIGNTTIPERPFMEQTAIDYEDDIGDFMVDCIDGLTLGAFKPKQILSKIGTEYEMLTKLSIDDFDTPRNHPSTVSKKKFDDPLIETKTMRNSVKFKIVGKR